MYTQPFSLVLPMGRSGGISIKKELVIFLIALALIQGAYGIQITASGSSNGESGSVSMNFDTLKSTSVSSQIAISGATMTPSVALAGPIAKFEQTHSVWEPFGKSAQVYVKVLNAPNGLTYSSKLLPKEGLVVNQPYVSAEQWLTVPKADSIKCTATSSYGSLSANVGLEEAKSATAGDYVTLSGYYGKALTTGTLVSASQTATSGAANSIKIYGTAKDSSGTYKVDTPLKSISGGKATFAGLSETSTAGTTTQVVQKEHVHGTFISTATFTPPPGTTLTKTRTSNYGTDYDLNMKVAKGSLPTGTAGYYIKPGTTANKIQGAVNAAESGDTINVAAGTYKENVKIDRSMTVKGAGSTTTIVDGNKAGSVFTIGMNKQNIGVVLSGMAIQGGSGTMNSDNLLYGGGILNFGTLIVIGSKISGNTAGVGGGISNWGTLTVADGTISQNIATRNGGGIANLNKLTVTSSTISKNIASSSSTYYGGGIANYKGTATLTGNIISGNTAAYGGGVGNDAGTVTLTGNTISGNKANHGGGIANWGTLTVNGGTVSGNKAAYGGGIANEKGSSSEYYGKLTVTDGTISGNTAEYGGGGIYNAYALNLRGTTQITNNLATSYGYGGGIYSIDGSDKLIFDGTKVAVKNNEAYMLDSESKWYHGWGIYLKTGAPNQYNGFNPATQVTGNAKAALRITDTNLDKLAAYPVNAYSDHLDKYGKKDGELLLWWSNGENLVAKNKRGVDSLGYPTTVPTDRKYTQLNDNINSNLWGQCVSAIKALANDDAVVGRWKPGKQVVNGGISRGTAIATFDANGKFNGHVAIFKGYTSNGIEVWDQNWFTPIPGIYGSADKDTGVVGKHDILRGGNVAVENADKYYTVLVRTDPVLPIWSEG